MNAVLRLASPALATPHPSQLLAEHKVDVNDIDQLHSFITSMEGRHERRMHSARPAGVDIRVARLDRVHVGVARFDTAMTVERQRASDSPYLVHFPLTEPVRLEKNGQEHEIRPGGGLIMSPSGHIRRRGNPGWVLLVAIDIALVRFRLARMLGRATDSLVDFHPVISAAASELRAYVLLLINAIDQKSVAPGSPVAQVLEAGLVDLLLELQPHSHAASVAAAGSENNSTRVEVLQAYIDAHLPEPLSVRRLSEVAGCSVRALQQLFQNYCGVGATEFVRTRRLARARELLQAARPGATVTSIATGVGFTQLARFAGQYKGAYGEYPSQTLGRKGAGAAPDKALSEKLSPGPGRQRKKMEC